MCGIACAVLCCCMLPCVAVCCVVLCAAPGVLQCVALFGSLQQSQTALWLSVSLVAQLCDRDAQGFDKRP